MATLPSRSGSDLDLAARLGEQLAVERVRQGDTLALEMIFLAYRAELLALATPIVGGRAMAEEVVQDVFLTIWARRERWHIATSLRGYLRRAVRNLAVRSGAARARGGARDVELGCAEAAAPGYFADPAPRADAAVERAELAETVERAVRALPPRAREVFTLRRDRELSNREIAARLGLSVKTVEIHMTRALAALRRLLADRRSERG